MIRKKESRHTEKEKALFRELEEYEKSGCQMFLNGRPSGPSKIVSACMRERGSYMRDFVGDEEERIKGINFIRIDEKT